MRQGIVMEKHRRYAIVMTEDGSFQKAKPIPNSMPGDEVEFELFEEKQWSFAVFPKKLKPNYRMIAMVTAFLIAILPLYSWFESNQAYAYVNIDMNPSIEMKVNNNMKVKELIPLNDDASLLVEKITDWKNKSVEKVTVTVIEKGEETGLISNNKNVMVGVSYKNRMQQDKQITKMIDQYLQTNPINLTVATFEVPEEIRNQAQKEKTSMNELFAKQYDETASNTSENETEINEEEKEAIQTFYNQGNKNDEKAPDSKDKGNESKNGQTPGKGENRNNKGKSSTNPAGKEKGWEKNKDKNKDKEDLDDDNHQEKDLPNGLNKKKEDLEDLLKSLPPGIQKKLEREGYEDIEEILESLPPGIKKKIETSDLEEIKENLGRLDPGSFSDLSRDEREDEKRHHKGKSEEEPPGQAKKDKEKQDDDREDQEREWLERFQDELENHVNDSRG